LTVLLDLSDMKSLYLFAVIALFSMFTSAQSIPVPENYKYKDAADYEQYKANVVECLHWFIDHKVSENPDQRRQVYTFLLKWCSGSPTVKIKLNDRVAKPIFDDNNFAYNPDILMAYIGGMALYLIDLDGTRNEADVQMEGLKTVLQLYENNLSELAGSKAIQEYVKLNESGKLENWVKSKLGTK
jgi:hypothetical protein